MFEFLATGKSICITKVVLSVFTLSWRKDWFRVDMEATRDDKPSSSYHLILLVEIPMKKYFVMITLFLRKCTTTVIGTKSRYCSLGKIIPSTKWRIAILADEFIRNHCTQSCAGRLHLQSCFSKRRSNIVRKTLDSTTAPKVTLKNNWQSQQQQQQVD